MTLQTTRQSTAGRVGALSAGVLLSLTACGGEQTAADSPQAAATSSAGPDPASSSACDVQELLAASDAVVDDSLMVLENLGRYAPLALEALSAGLTGDSSSVESSLDQLREEVDPPDAAAVAADYEAAREQCTGTEVAEAAAPAGCDVDALVRASDAVADTATDLREAGGELEQVVRDAVGDITQVSPDQVSAVTDRLEEIRSGVVDEQAQVAEEYTAARDACTG